MTDMAVPLQNSGLLDRMWRAYAPPFALWLIYYAGVQLALMPYDTPVVLITERFFPMYTLACGGFITFWAISVFLRYSMLGHLPARDRWQRITGHINWTEALGPGPIPPLVMVFTVMGIFKSFKPHIPDLNPFSWDHLFLEWDRYLFFGHDGWQLTHWLLPEHWMTMVIDRLYLAWFLVVLATVLTAAFAPLTSRRRLAFLMTFNLNWIVAGSIVAVLFSSAGPVFLDRLTGDTTYLPLMERLQAADEAVVIWGMNTVELLWSGYMKEPDVVVYGISAFPSLHVCMSMLVVLYLQGLGRWIAWISWFFFGIVVFGSVHLGWHYLWDGIAGAALCYANWRASLWFARRWLKEQEDGASRSSP